MERRLALGGWSGNRGGGRTLTHPSPPFPVMLHPFREVTKATEWLRWPSAKADTQLLQHSVLERGESRPSSCSLAAEPAPSCRPALVPCSLGPTQVLGTGPPVQRLPQAGVAVLPLRCPNCWWPSNCPDRTPSPDLGTSHLARGPACWMCPVNTTE